MVIALAFFKRIFTQSLPTNQAHGLIIAEVCGDASFARGLAKIRKFVDGRSMDVAARSIRFAVAS
jgi:hypothetical protein